MDIKIKILCPTCDSPIEAKKHRGIVSNRALFLASQMISLREQEAKLTTKKGEKTSEETVSRLNKIRAQIADMEKEHKLLLLVLSS